MPKRANNITLVFFFFLVDDSLIFCRAMREDCTSLENILETYEHVSGQQLNWDKTSLFFSSNTPQDI